MVLPRGSESWRRSSRFRRQSLVKPMAAEVLEPRCLMTEATGTLAAVDAAPLNGDVVIGPDLWDDAGLTLLRDGDLVHLVRTGTTHDVTAPFAVDVPGQLVIQGRDNARDVLTVDLSGSTAAPGDSNGRPIFCLKRLVFDGGSGPTVDELRAVGEVNDAVLNQFLLFPDESTGAFLRMPPEGGTCVSFFDFALKQVKHVAVETVGPRGISQFWFQDQNNVITINGQPDEEGLASVVDQATDIEIRVPADSLYVDGGVGNDQITIASSKLLQLINVYGGEGNDTLVGSDESDALMGGPGNDSLDGRGGNDFLNGDDGDDSIDGGLGTDTVQSWDYSAEGHRTIIVSPTTMTGFGDDRLANVETITLAVSNHSLVDASAASQRIEVGAIDGNCTLIGGSGNDSFRVSGGYNLVIGGDGHDWLTSDDSVTDTLDGGAGIDTINDVTEAVQIQSDVGSSDPQSDTLQSQSTDSSGGNASVIATDPSSDTNNSDLNNDNISGDSLAIAADPPSDSSAGTPSDDTLGAALPTDDNSVIPTDGRDLSGSPSPGDVLLIGQGIATVGIEDRELAEFDTASSDSAFGELADSEPESSSDLAANGDINSADVGDELKLDTALSNDFLVSLAKQPT